MTGSESPLVSVVMPVYNAERFLRQAIDSVLCQTYRNLELIMVDDCSSDSSMQIMQEYQMKDARVRVIAAEMNQGVARARNRGIQEAKGEYIALLDSDDVWMKSKLEKQIVFLKETGMNMVCCSVDFIDEHDRLRNKVFAVPREIDYQKMLGRNVIICSTVLAEAALLKSHPFNPEYYHEDYVLWMELLDAGARIAGDAEVQACYRLVNGSRSNNKINAAKHRWKIYREALGLSVLQSAAVFVRYAFWGAVKYYLPSFR